MRGIWVHIVAFWKKYEHHLGVGALLVGFTFDLFLAKRPDSIVDNVLLVSYLFIAAAVIIILNAHAHAHARRAEAGATPLILLLILQFCFGGLASNMLVLYGKSGSLAGSALFILFLLGLVFGNEFLRNRYAQLRFNIGMYYLLLFTYLIISVPTFVAHAIGPRVFLLSGATSLVIIIIFLTVVFGTVLRGRKKARQMIEVSVLVGVIFVAMNGLYFFNIIPPVPLSLKDIGLYHSISRDALGHYSGTYEPAPWYTFWRDTSATYTYAPGAVAYCFSAVYAPTNLDTPISHVWQEYDTASHTWVEKLRVTFPIVGGVAQGYKGYSIATLAPGQWRCNVETSQGALIGSLSFTAVESAQTPTLSTATL